MGYRLLIKFIVAICCVSPALSSEAFASDRFASRGGWDIYKDTNACGMTTEFNGPGATTLVLIKFADGTFGISIKNKLWSANEDSDYNVSYALNGATYAGGKAKGSGTLGARGFLSFFDSSFEADFAQGTTLVVYLDDREIDRLSLKGSATALQSVNECLVRVRANLAAQEQERARWAHLPRDPFATPPTPPKLSRPAIPSGYSGGWIYPSDYPAVAKREKRQGVAVFSVDISLNGRVTDCVITASSGSPDLDATTCTLVSKRARFLPAKDFEGNPTQGFYVGSVRWSLPSD